MSGREVKSIRFRTKWNTVASAVRTSQEDCLSYWVGGIYEAKYLQISLSVPMGCKDVNAACRISDVVV